MPSHHPLPFSLHPKEHMFFLRIPPVPRKICDAFIVQVAKWLIAFYAVSHGKYRATIILAPWPIQAALGPRLVCWGPNPMDVLLAGDGLKWQVAKIIKTSRYDFCCNRGLCFSQDLHELARRTLCCF